MTHENNLKLVKEAKTKHFFLMKDGYFYRPNSQGYTENIYDAGVYSKEEVLSHISHTSKVRAIPVDVKEYNKGLLDLLIKTANKVLNDE